MATTASIYKVVSGRCGMQVLEIKKSGGEGGIRTLGTVLASTTV